MKRNILKKGSILLLAFMFLFIGCGLTNFLCSPTESQAAAAATGLSIAQTILTAAATIGPTIAGQPDLSPIANMIASQAIPTLKKVWDGYCVTQGEWDNAISTLNTAQKSMINAGVKAIGPTQKGFDLSQLQTIRW